MPSAQLQAQADRNVSEADIRALALAKVRATKAYNAVLYADTKNSSDEELVDHELALSAARKAMFAANSAFDKAV